MHCNISQVPGIGPKIAAGLINEFGTLSNLIRQADTIKQKKRRESVIENAEKVRDEFCVLDSDYLLVVTQNTLLKRLFRIFTRFYYSARL